MTERGGRFTEAEIAERAALIARETVPVIETFLGIRFACRQRLEKRLRALFEDEIASAVGNQPWSRIQ